MDLRTCPFGCSLERNPPLCGHHVGKALDEKFYESVGLHPPQRLRPGDRILANNVFRDSVVSDIESAG